MNAKQACRIRPVPTVVGTDIEYFKMSGLLPSWPKPVDEGKRFGGVGTGPIRNLALVAIPAYGVLASRALWTGTMEAGRHGGRSRCKEGLLAVNYFKRHSHKVKVSQRFL